MSDRRIKCWMVTFPATEDNDYTELFTEYDKDEVHYAVWQLERGDNKSTQNPCGYLHVQLYIEFTRPRTFDQAKIFLGASAHIEIPKKVRKACIAYCKKRETRVAGPWEFGDVNAKNQGKRSDLDEIKDQLDHGADVRSLANDHFGSWCRYKRAFDDYAATRDVKVGPQRDGTRQPHVIVVYGSSGSGKSRWAFLRNPSAYRAMPGKDASRNTYYWERYGGQDCVIFDDFTDDQLSLQEFCRITDPYPLLVPCKGASVDFRASEIIFTSNVDPIKWWNVRDAEEMLPQVHRRVDHVINLEKTHDGKFQSVCFTPCKKCSWGDDISLPPVEGNEGIDALLKEIEKQDNVIDLTQVE